MDRREVSTKPRRLGWARAVYSGDVRDRVRCLKGGFGLVILNGSIAAAAKTRRDEPEKGTFTSNNGGDPAVWSRADPGRTRLLPADR